MHPLLLKDVIMKEVFDPEFKNTVLIVLAVILIVAFVLF